MSRFQCAGYVECTATRLKGRHWTIPGGRNCSRNNQRTRHLQRASPICRDQSQGNASSHMPAPPNRFVPTPKSTTMRFQGRSVRSKLREITFGGETGEARVRRCRQLYHPWRRLWRLMVYSRVTTSSFLAPPGRCFLSAIALPPCLLLQRQLVTAAAKVWETLGVAPRGLVGSRRYISALSSNWAGRMGLGPSFWKPITSWAMGVGIWRVLYPMNVVNFQN